MTEASGCAMTDRELLSALESCTLPPSGFGHAAHVRAAYLYLQRFDFATALQRMSSILRAYTASLGRPERYHETITVAYMALIGRAITERGDAGGWPRFVQQNPRLLDPDLLLHFYTREELTLPLGRRTFLLPQARLGAPE